MVTVKSLELDLGSYPVLLHGKPGCGKTHMLGTIAKAGKKLVIMDVNGGPNTIFRMLSPDERRLVKVISGITSVRAFAEAYKEAERLMRGGGDFLCLDCCTPLQKHVSREARAELSVDGNAGAMITTKALSIPLNDAIKQRMEDIANAILALPGGKVFTFWSSQNADDRWEPSTRGDVWQYFAGSCELICYLTTEAPKRDFGDEQEKNKEVKYRAYTAQVGPWEARDRLNILPPEIPPDFSVILDRLNEAMGSK